MQEWLNSAKAVAFNENMFFSDVNKARLENIAFNLALFNNGEYFNRYKK